MGRVTGAQGVQGGAVGAAGALSTTIPGCMGEVAGIGWVLGRDQKSGTSSGTYCETLYEIKVPSLLKQSFAAGRGSNKHSGCAASVGHLYGFGSTAEQLRVKVKGCRARGSERQGPFDHATGKGWVKERRGDYYDAIHIKKHRTLLFLVESSGGIGGDGQEQCVRLSKRARGHIGADRTTYGTLRTSPQTFLTHHIQQITKAAVFYDAKAILRSVDVRKAVAARPHDGAPPTQPRSRPAQHRPHPTRTLTRTRMAR